MAKTHLGRFQTIRGGRPRTVGTIVDLGRGPLVADTAQALTYHAAAGRRRPWPSGVARGKVAFASGELTSRTAVVFQVSGQSAEPAACGNGLAALAAWVCAGEGRGDLDVVATTPAVRSRASVVIDDRRGVAVVRQTWRLPTPRVTRLTVVGYAAVAVEGLNDYLVVAAPATHAVAAAIWDAVAFDRRVTTRIAIAGEPPGPPVLFWGPLGAHPSAPLTGLLAVALARQTVPCVAARLPAPYILAPDEEVLPCVVGGGPVGIDVELPTVEVVLEEVDES